MRDTYCNEYSVYNCNIYWYTHIYGSVMNNAAAWHNALCKCKIS